MSNNSIILPKFEEITQEELETEYMKLVGKYNELRQIHEKDSQRIHELKGSLQAAISTEGFLEEELDLLAKAEDAKIDDLKNKHSQEIETLKVKYTKLSTEHHDVQQKCDGLKKENCKLQKKLEELNVNVVKNDSNESTLELIEKKFELEKENLDLLRKMDTLHEKINNYEIIISGYKGKIEDNKEDMNVLQDIVRSKREEIDEKTDLLESAQKQISDLNAELALLKTNPESLKQKGNSLFAEVDDQRKIMRKMLQEQNTKFVQMKKLYNQSDREIRKLKRENAAMHREIETCTAVFFNAEHRYKEKLNNHTHQLLIRNNELEKRLHWTESRLIEMSKSKGVNWLESMLSFCKHETESLKNQLHNCLIEKGLLNNRLLEIEQELAKWRFETLQLRCILLNRENLLEENNIKFNIIKSFSYEDIAHNLKTSTPRLHLTEKFLNNIKHNENLNEDTSVLASDSGIDNKILSEEGNNSTKSANSSSCNSSFREKSVFTEGEEIQSITQPLVSGEENTILGKSNTAEEISLNNFTVNNKENYIEMPKSPVDLVKNEISTQCEDINNKPGSISSNNPPFENCPLTVNSAKSYFEVSVSENTLVKYLDAQKSEQLNASKYQENNENRTEVKNKTESIMSTTRSTDIPQCSGEGTNKNLSSILVKNRNVLQANNNLKIKFNCPDTNSFNHEETHLEESRKKKRENIVIRKIVFKSKPAKKE